MSLLPAPWTVDNSKDPHVVQLSLSRLDRYTLHVATSICQHFKLSVNGQRHLNKALGDLPCVPTADPRLTFGWPEDHPLRSRYVTQHSYEHLAIMTALADTFHKEYAAEVMHRLAIGLLKDPAITPHKSQWRDLIRTVNGVLAADDFGLLVEKYIRMDPFGIAPGAAGSSGSARSSTRSRSVAEAIQAMSEVADGRRKNLTLSGGAVIAWIAAVAEHFFDMDIAVFSCKDQHLHGLQKAGEAGLTLIYDGEPKLKIVETVAVPHEAVMEKTPIINELAYGLQMHILPFGGRVTWEALLPQVFGQAFHRLEHGYSKLMFTAIGSAFRALEEASEDIGNSCPADRPKVQATSLLKTLAAYLPALQRGSGKMERQMKLSPHHAAEVYGHSLLEARSICNCAICTPGLTFSRVSSFGSMNVPRAAATSSPISTTTNTIPKTSPKDSSYCLPCIISTIIDLGLILNRVILAQTGIEPSRQGVQLLYKKRTEIEQNFQRQQQHQTHQSHSESQAKHIRRPRTQTAAGAVERGSIAAIQEDTGNDNAASQTKAEDASSNVALKLHDDVLRASYATTLYSVVELFSGALMNEAMPESLIAVAHEGICAFSTELVSGQRRTKDSLQGMVRVCAGTIGLGQKMYTRACRAKRPETGSHAWLWEEVKLEHFEDVLWCR